MKKFLQFGWVILLDVIAVCLLIIALLFGWLPGAPGIPIALAGLGLLAINHDWAKRMLERIKTEGRQLYEKLKHKFNKQ